MDAQKPDKGAAPDGSGESRIVPPPRRVPWLLSAHVVLGGRVQPMVWILFCLVLAFCEPGQHELLGPLFVPPLFWFSLRGFKRWQLLRYGTAAEATLRSSQNTGMETYLDEEPIYKLGFSYPDATGLEHFESIYTADADVLQDEELELILYDPSNPSHCYLLHHMPGPPGLSDERELVSFSSPLISVLLLALPVTALFLAAAAALGLTLMDLLI